MSAVVQDAYVVSDEPGLVGPGPAFGDVPPFDPARLARIATRAAAYRSHHRLSRSLQTIGHLFDSRYRSRLPRCVALEVECGWVHLLWHGAADQAARIFDRVVDERPDNDQAHIGRVSARRALRDLGDARRKLEEAKEHVVSPSYLLVEEGFLAIDEGRHDDALSLFRRALATRPDDRYAISGVSSMLRHQGHFAQARALLTRKLRELGDDPILLDSYGWLEYDEYHYEEAERRFRDVLENEPGERLALLWLPRALRKQCKFREAEDELRAAEGLLCGEEISADLRRPFVEERGWLEFARCHYADACRLFDEAYRGYSDEVCPVEGVYAKVGVRLTLGRVSEAEHILRHARSCERRVADLSRAQALVEFEGHRYSEAEELLRRSLDAGGENDIDSRQLLVATLRDQGPTRRADARKAIDAALSDFPSDPALLEEQATLDYLDGRYEESLAHFSEAARINRYDVAALVGQSTALRAMCQGARAKDFISKACEKWDRRWVDPSLHKERGIVLYSNGEYGDAAYEFRKSLQVAYDEETMTGLVDALRGSGEYAKARQTVDAAIRVARSSASDPNAFAALVVALGWSKRQSRLARRELKERRGDDVPLLLASARLYEEQGKLSHAYQEANEAWRTAKRKNYAVIDPARVVATAKCIRLKRALESPRKAREFGEREWPDLPRPVLIDCELALCYRDDREYGQMSAVVDNALAKDRWDPGVRQLASVAAWERRDWREAERCAREALRELGDVAGLRCELGWTLYGQHRWHEAWEEFELVLRDKDRGDERAAIGASESLLMLGRFDDATSLLRGARECREKKGDDEDRRTGSLFELDLALARAECGDGRGEQEAAATLRGLLDDLRAEATPSGSADGSAAGEAKPGLGDLESDLRRPTKESEARWTRRAWTTFALVRFRGESEVGAELASQYQDEARRVLEALATHEGARVEEQTLLAWILVFGGPGGDRPAQEALCAAKTHCENALARDRYSVTATACLGVVYWYLDQLQPAEEYLRRAKEMDAYAGYGVYLGAFYLDSRVDRPEEAERILRDVLTADPHDPSAHYQQGRALVRLNRHEEARAAFRRTLGLRPNWICAARALALVTVACKGGEKENDLADLREAEELLTRSWLRLPPVLQDRYEALVKTALARILLRRGDLAEDPTLFREALAKVEGVAGHESNTELCWYAGVARAKLAEAGGRARVRRPEHVREACKYFERCKESDEHKLEAEDYLRALGSSESFVGRRVLSHVLSTPWGRCLYGAFWALAVLVVGYLALRSTVPLADKYKLAVLATVTLGPLALPHIKSVKVQNLEVQLREPRKENSSAITSKLGLGRVAYVSVTPSATLAMTDPHESSEKLTRMRAGAQAAVAPRLGEARNLSSRQGDYLSPARKRDRMMN